MAKDSTGSGSVCVSTEATPKLALDVEKGLEQPQEIESLIPHTVEYEKKYGIYGQGTCFDRVKTPASWEIKDLYVSVPYLRGIHQLIPPGKICRI